MSIDDSGIPSTAPGGVGVPASRPSPREEVSALVEKPRRRIRAALDPFDLESALARLAQLLASDGDTPQRNVPRGYYIYILV